jgi:hypothetical protein
MDVPSNDDMWGIFPKSRALRSAEVKVTGVSTGFGPRTRRSRDVVHELRTDFVDFERDGVEAGVVRVGFDGFERVCDVGFCVARVRFRADCGIDFICFLSQRFEKMNTSPDLVGEYWRHDLCTTMMDAVNKISIQTQDKRLTL